MSQRRSSKTRAKNRQEPISQRDRAQGKSSVSRRAQRRIEEERNQRRRRFMLLGGAVVLAVVVVATLIALNRPDDEGEAADLAVISPPPRDDSIPADGRTLGDPDAPVTVVEYADFQCPACAQFALTFEPRLIEDYIATGQVKLVYHDFPFLDDRSEGNESNLASEAAFCAQEQGEFWSYHDVLYANQAGENEGAFARDRLIEMASHVEGIDVEQFTSCLDSGEYEDDVEQLYEESIQQGIASTPTFVVDGNVVTGSNYPALQQAIEEALAS